jgi:hypothetical protein
MQFSVIPPDVCRAHALLAGEAQPVAGSSANDAKARAAEALRAQILASAQAAHSDAAASAATSHPTDDDAGPAIYTPQGIAAPAAAAEQDELVDGAAAADWQGADPEQNEWADDVEYEREAFPGADGDADNGQDLDHLLPASERLWESTKVGESLPPGWAKCPNMGSEVFGITPIKVCPTCY